MRRKSVLKMPSLFVFPFQFITKFFKVYHLFSAWICFVFIVLTLPSKFYHLKPNCNHSISFFFISPQVKHIPPFFFKSADFYTHCFKHPSIMVFSYYFPHHSHSLTSCDWIIIGHTQYGGFNTMF